jgi:hypothetical protein
MGNGESSAQHFLPLNRIAQLPACFMLILVEFKEDVAKEAMGATKGTTPKRNIGVLPRWTPPEHAKWSLVARILPLHGQWRVICAALPAAKPNRAASSLFYAHSFRTVKKRKMSHNSGGLIYLPTRRRFPSFSDRSTAVGFSFPQHTSSPGSYPRSSLA